MWYLAILVAFGVSTVNGQLPTVAVPTINCAPSLVAPNLVGGTTLSTFTLQNPCCIARDPRILPSDTLVNVVGFGDGINRLNDLTFNVNNPPLFSNLSNTGFFAATNGLVGDLCPLNGNLPAGLRIGDNVFCLINGNIPYCNAPLPYLGPYRVLQLVYRNGTLIFRTPVSSNISLRNPRDFRSIDTSIKHHSATMIVITTILPILFALLLAIFISMLFMSCCCCRVFTPKKCQES